MTFTIGALNKLWYCLNQRLY